jgi:hypothetical protein
MRYDVATVFRVLAKGFTAHKKKSGITRFARSGCAGHLFRFFLVLRCAFSRG